MTEPVIAEAAGTLGGKGVRGAAIVAATTSAIEKALARNPDATADEILMIKETVRDSIKATFVAPPPTLEEMAAHAAKVAAAMANAANEQLELKIDVAEAAYGDGADREKLRAVVAALLPGFSAENLAYVASFSDDDDENVRDDFIDKDFIEYRE